MNLMGLEETLDRPSKANEVRWFGHVLRRDNDGVLRRALNFKVIEKEGVGDQR